MTGDQERACAEALDVVVAARRGEHRMLLAVADLVARNVAGASGYRTVRRLLEDLWRVNPARARRLVTQAALLLPSTSMTGEVLPPALPATAAVHEQGLVEDEHLRVIASTMEHLARIPGLDPQQYADAETTLAEYATTLAPRGVEKVALRLITTLDPDGAAPVEDGEPLDELHLVRRRDGRVQGGFAFHAGAEAELLVEVFDRLSAPAGPDDPRTLAQRRAEVLADLAAQAASPTGIAAPDQHDHSADRRSDCCDHDRTDEPDDSAETEGTEGTELGEETGDEPGDDEPVGNTEAAPAPATSHFASGTPRPSRASRASGCPTVPVLGRALLAVTMDLQWLTSQIGHGLLDSDHPVDPTVARRLACDAGIVPMILGSRSEPLDVGRLSYTVPDGMRRALHVRDRGCTFPGCTRRPRRCHAHHIKHWLDGGPTELDNLTLLCRYHHQLIHHDHWSIHMTDSRPWFYPPTWVDPDQRPRPGGPHPLADAA